MIIAAILIAGLLYRAYLTRTVLTTWRAYVYPAVLVLLIVLPLTAIVGIFSSIPFVTVDLRAIPLWTIPWLGLAAWLSIPFFTEMYVYYAIPIDCPDLFEQIVRAEKCSRWWLAILWDYEIGKTCKFERFLRVRFFAWWATFVFTVGAFYVSNSI